MVMARPQSHDLKYTFQIITCFKFKNKYFFKYVLVVLTCSSTMTWFSFIALLTFTISYIIYPCLISIAYQWDNAVPIEITCLIGHWLLYNSNEDPDDNTNMREFDVKSKFYSNQIQSPRSCSKLEEILCRKAALSPSQMKSINAVAIFAERKRATLITTWHGTTLPNNTI